MTARVGKYIKAVKRSVKQIDTQIESLQNETESFRSIYLSLNELCIAAPGTAASASHPAAPNILRKRATEQVQIINGIIESLEAILVKIVVGETSGYW